MFEHNFLLLFFIDLTLCGNIISILNKTSVLLIIILSHTCMIFENVLKLNQCVSDNYSELLQ